MIEQKKCKCPKKIVSTIYEYSEEEKAMADQLVREWIEDYSSLTESEIHTYATELEHNQEVMSAIYVVLEEPASFSGGFVSVSFLCFKAFIFYSLIKF